MASTIPVSSPEDLQIKRKRMLAQMLMGQAQQQQGQMVGGQFIPPSTLGVINSSVSPILGMKASLDADNKELAINEEKRKKLAQVLTGAFSDTSQAPTQTASTLLANPETQQLGQQLLLNDFQEKQKLANLKTSEQVKADADINKISDPRYIEAQSRIRAAGKPETNINVSTEKKYGEKFAENIAKSDSDLRDSAGKAVNLAERANQIKQVLASGNVATGIGADYKLAFGKAAAAAGIKGADDFAANTEVLSSSLAQNTLDAIKASGLGSGSGFSNADRDFLEKAVGGKITLEPNSISRLADLAHRAASQSATRWNKRMKEIPSEAIQGTGLSREEIKVPDLFGANVGQVKNINGKNYILKDGKWYEQ